jgi:hypothetical protein
MPILVLFPGVIGETIPPGKSGLLIWPESKKVIQLRNTRNLGFQSSKQEKILNPVLFLTIVLTANNQTVVLRALKLFRKYIIRSNDPKTLTFILKMKGF